jgi:hypothetical protein
MTTRIELYFILIIGSYDNNSFITKSNTIEIQKVFSISGDYIILYKS